MMAPMYAAGLDFVDAISRAARAEAKTRFFDFKSLAASPFPFGPKTSLDRSKYCFSSLGLSLKSSNGVSAPFFLLFHSLLFS